MRSFKRGDGGKVVDKRNQLGALIKGGGHVPRKRPSSQQPGFYSFQDRSRADDLADEPDAPDAADALAEPGRAAGVDGRTSVREPSGADGTSPEENAATSAPPGAPAKKPRRGRRRAGTRLSSRALRAQLADWINLQNLVELRQDRAPGPGGDAVFTLRDRGGRSVQIWTQGERDDEVQRVWFVMESRAKKPMQFAGKAAISLARLLEPLRPSRLDQGDRSVTALVDCLRDQGG